MGKRTAGTIIVRKTKPHRGLVWAATSPAVPGLTCRGRTRRSARELLVAVASDMARRSGR